MQSTVIPISLGMVQTFLLRGERPILIDAGPPKQEEKILNALQANGIEPKDIALILITHCHSDHVGSLRALQERTEAKIAVHEMEAEALRQGKSAELQPTSGLGRFFRLFLSENARVPGVEPDITISNELNLQEFGLQGKVVATPGHTSGSLSVVLDSGEMLIGDLLMGGFLLHRTVPNYPWFASDMEKLRHSLNLLMAYHPKMIYASHGGPFDPQVIREKFSL